MTDQTPIPPATKEPLLYGVVDVLRADRVAGWVIDRTDPARHAIVEIRREGRLIGTVTANRPRKDLERQAVGTGAYGFAFTFDPPLEEGMEFTVAVRARSQDGAELALQPVANAARTISAEKRALGRILEELADLRDDMGDLRRNLATAEQGRQPFQERLELVQLRIETAISTMAAPPEKHSGWLAATAIGGAIIAVGSLAIGIISLFSG